MLPSCHIPESNKKEMLQCLHCNISAFLSLTRLFTAAAKTLSNFVNKVKVKIFCCKEILTHRTHTALLYLCIKDTTNAQKFNPFRKLIIHYHLKPSLFPSHPFPTFLKFPFSFNRNLSVRAELSLMDCSPVTRTFPKGGVFAWPVLFL